MNQKNIVAIDCDLNEKRLFERSAMRCGATVHFTRLGDFTKIPYGAPVSVSHKARLTPEQLTALRERGVEYVSSRSIGLDHIDLACARRLGITVEDSPYSPEGVAEHAVMLMLMAARSARETLKRVEHNDFRLNGTPAKMLGRMTVGVVGAGRIGRRVIEQLRGFGSEVLAYDERESLAVPYVPLDELLQSSDLVTLHLPLLETTRRLLDAKRIARMKKNAILVNVARGELVDTRALIEALAERRLSAAALDVIEGEKGWFYRDCSHLNPPPQIEALLNQNVIITPHTAFHTQKALEEIVERSLNNCINSLRKPRLTARPSCADSRCPRARREESWIS